MAETTNPLNPAFEPPNRKLLDLLDSLIASNESNERGPERVSLASQIEPIIWGWAKTAPTEVLRLGERLMVFGFPSEMTRLAGLCLLSGSHHDPARQPIRFTASTWISASRAEPAGRLQINATYIDFSSLPWQEDSFPTLLTLTQFEAIACKVVTAHDERCPVHSTAQVLAAYDNVLAATGFRVLAPFDLIPEEWRVLRRETEEAGQRSRIAAAVASASAPTPRPPTL